MAQEKTISFSDRKLKNHHLEFKGIRGTGVTGFWLFELRCLESFQGGERRARFIIQLIPTSLRFSRISMLSNTDLTGSRVEVPCAAEYEHWLKEKMVGTKIRFRRTRQGPRFMIEQLTAMMLAESIDPDSIVLNEVRAYIMNHLEQPEFVKNTVKQSEYHFGDAEIGRFFVKETASNSKDVPFEKATEDGF